MTCCAVAGTVSGGTSSASSDTRWVGKIALSANSVNNITIEYHNGGGDASLVIRAGFNTATDTSNVGLCSC